MVRSADDVAEELLTWASAVVPEAQAAARPLGAAERQPGLDLRLLRASPHPTPRTPSRPLIVDLDFLITVQLADAAAEQRAVTELLFAAMARDDVEVLAGEAIATHCAAIGVALAPGLVLRAPLVRAVETVRAPRVGRFGLDASPLGVIAGRVLGPGDVPVAGAAVSAAGLGRPVRTDAEGRFQIVAAPTSARVRLVAKAHGAQAEAIAVAGRPITLRLPLEN